MEKDDLGATPQRSPEHVPEAVPQRSHDEPFTVEVDKDGCERCSHGTQWTVCGPDDTYIGQSFEDKVLVEEIADYMNQGFRAGSSAIRERLRGALDTFRSRAPEPTLTSYGAYAVNGLIEAIEKALDQ